MDTLGKVSITSFFECIINLIVFETKITAITKIVIPNAMQDPPKTDPPSSSAKLLYAFMQEQNYGPEDRHIDTKLGYWLATKNMPLRYHLPSLCDHTGALCSTLYIPEAIRKAFRFTGNVKDVE